jgi:hypothetical protein
MICNVEQLHRGNEIADMLAGKAAVNDILEMDKSDLQTAI